MQVGASQNLQHWYQNKDSSLRVFQHLFSWGDTKKNKNWSFQRLLRLALFRGQTGYPSFGCKPLKCFFLLFRHETTLVAGGIRDHCRYFRIFPGWWFQPIWKICTSNWIISAGIGVKIKKYLSCHHLVSLLIWTIKLNWCRENEKQIIYRHQSRVHHPWN